MKISIFWFRRDLRLEDNAALFHALKGPHPVLPVFIFDTNILDEPEDKEDRRVTFIYQQVLKLNKQLRQWGSTLQTYHTTPLKAFEEIIRSYDVVSVFTNRDYEPYARQRDEAVVALLKRKSIAFISYKDQVIFDTSEVIKDNGDPYTVFTPYSKKWRSLLKAEHLQWYDTTKYKERFYQTDASPVPILKDLGFKEVKESFPATAIDENQIRSYDKTRDIISFEGTSKLSVHLRFGTISIRHLVAQALKWNETYLSELIWREFFMMILWHFPKVVNTSFHEAYDNIQWRNNEEEFALWCAGKTGYPIVDAGMRELNQTGYMHNRVRMIVASFLTKHLLIDWRWGEAYFAKKLLDYDLAANNGNWQWAAGCGCDAAPYFRIFSPQRQTEKFDPQFIYIKKWVPEYGTEDYPEPVVEHSFARDRCLQAYKKALNRT